MKEIFSVLSLILLIGCQNTNDSLVNVNSSNEGDEGEYTQENEQEETILEAYQRVVTLSLGCMMCLVPES